MARQERRALLILDLLMPDLDGFAVLERLRADPATAAIPIVIPTSQSLTPHEKARLNGEIAYLARKGDSPACRSSSWSRGSCQEGGTGKLTVHRARLKEVEGHGG